MVAEEFINLVGQFKWSTYVGMEDFADRLNFMFSVVFIILSMMVVTIKSYFFKPLACYVPTTPSGSNFDNYLENYCWVHGTISILPGEAIPQTSTDWAHADDDKRITYYQWVPFILGLQCIMFYIPRIIWQIVCYSKSGSDLESLIEQAHEINKVSPEDRKDTVEKIARSIEDMLWQHRDYRRGKVADMRRKVYSTCNFCVFSKHLGTWLVLSYLIMKVLYAFNVLGQLFLMKTFLGFKGPMASFGLEVLRNIVNGRNWHETGIFPRVTYCYLRDIRHLGASNKYVAQCALPINMLNEKIYIFLWFWMLLVGIVTVISIPIWFFRMSILSFRTKFIKKFLQMRNNYQGSSDKPGMAKFTREFLRHDGVFLIRMIYINAGDLVTSDIVNHLWLLYKEHYSDCDMRKYNNYAKPLQMGTVKKSDLGSNAPPHSDDSIEKEPINFV